MDWPRLSYREQYKEGDEEAVRENDEKTTREGGLALGGTICYRTQRTVGSGGSWLQNLQWFSHGRQDFGIGEGVCVSACIRTYTCI